MNASKKITLTIIAIFAAVFSVLSFALIEQAQNDIEQENQAALQLALRLGESTLSSDELQLIIQASRNLSLQANSSTDVSDSFIYRLFLPNTSTVTQSVTVHDSAGEPVRIYVNNHAELEEISATVLTVFFIFLLALVITLLTLRLTINKRIKPLAELCSGLDSIKSGKLELSTASTDIAEIHMLIEHYNNLISSLASKETQVSRLRKRLSALQENERRLLARELHDNLGQLITGITVQTYMLEQQKQNPDFIMRACSTIQQQCDAVHQGMKDLTNQLYPVFLGKLGLTTSIAQMIQTWQDIHQIDVHWLPDAPTLPSDLNRDTQVYRITQEIFNNIAKHADATEVTIGLSASDTTLALLIEDNGKGFSNISDSESVGLGLESMQERASLLGGKLTIDSGVQGTTVTLVAPLQLQDTPHYEYSDR